MAVWGGLALIAVVSVVLAAAAELIVAVELVVAVKVIVAIELIVAVKVLMATFVALMLGLEAVALLLAHPVAAVALAAALADGLALGHFHAEAILLILGLFGTAAPLFVLARILLVAAVAAKIFITQGKGSFSL
jgi:hypothetical protein